LAERLHTESADAATDGIVSALGDDPQDLQECLSSGSTSVEKLRVPLFQALGIGPSCSRRRQDFELLAMNALEATFEHPSVDLIEYIRADVKSQVGTHTKYS